MKKKTKKKIKNSDEIPHSSSACSINEFVFYRELQLGGAVDYKFGKLYDNFRVIRWNNDVTRCVIISVLVTASYGTFREQMRQ